MFEVLVLDLIHDRCPSCNGKSLEQLAAEVSPLAAGDALVFLLCGRYFQQANGGSCGSGPLTEPLLRGRRSVHVLDCDTVTERLCRLKHTVDQLDLSSVAVLTSRQGKETLLLYQKQLFTEVYSFEYYTAEEQLTCQRCCLAHSDSPGDRLNTEVTAFLQQLPALKGDVTTLTSTLIPDCFGHGFSTRAGGVSCIPTLSSLNLFSSSKRRDGRAVVEENRRRLAVHAGFHPQPLHMVKVNHASEVWVMGKTEPKSYDAIVTNQPGVVLAAPGADCMPILFADPVSKVIGAAHAGWKGTLMGVAMATVGAMVREFGCQVSDIIVAVGPSVGACCFTLGREPALDFARIHPDCVPDPHSARPHVNIRLANRTLLQKGGILPEHIHDDTVADRPCVTPCTSCHPEAFFSHVRDGLNFGTQVGFLWIK